MKINPESKSIASTAILGTAALLKTAALLGPLQVCGATASQEPSFSASPAASEESYNWHIQMVDDHASDHYLKEGTPTGSSGTNSLEDWND